MTTPKLGDKIKLAGQDFTVAGIGKVGDFLNLNEWDLEIIRELEQEAAEEEEKNKKDS